VARCVPRTILTRARRASAAALALLLVVTLAGSRRHPTHATEPVASAPGVLVVEHVSGHVMANAGVDRSNVGTLDEEQVLLLPVDPDGEAARLRAGLERLAGVAPAVVISDSIGRPWRNGTAAVAIG